MPRYGRDLPFSWLVGEFSVRFALEHAPDRVLEVRWHHALSSPERDYLEHLCERHEIPCLRDDRTVEAKRSKGSASVLAVFEKRSMPLAEHLPQVGLMAPIEPGNLGTALRTCLAFGIEDVAVMGDADVWSPHVLRASLGAICAMRVQSYPDLASFAAERQPVPWLLNGDAESSIGAVDPGPTFRVVVGPAWPGFTEPELALGTPVSIPIDARVESLNVALALGIALHAWRS